MGRRPRHPVRIDGRGPIGSRYDQPWERPQALAGVLGFTLLGAL